MKFVSFEIVTTIGRVRRIGTLRDGRIVDLHATYAAYLRDERGLWQWERMARAIVPTDMLTFIGGGDMSTDATQMALDYLERTGSQEKGQQGERFVYTMDQVHLLAPVPRPVAIRDCSAFLQHIGNAPGMRGRELPEVWHRRPAHYRTSTTNVIGPDEPILWPSYTEKLDFELEFAACIGTRGVNIPPEQADKHVFGYTIFNDISARDIQSEEMILHHGPAKGKSFENSNVMGPCLVTGDELDPSHLRMTARINGEVWSTGNSNTMSFTFPQLISYLSDNDPLYPGEFIASGTVGFGCGMELDRWIKPGDVIELEVEGIGVLKNRVERRHDRGSI
jgi:2-keto-4-pentenoate hydratase/2-oxohepta-3-ene-1,7-dioic acid hydratase in catechol pathway